MNIKKRTYYDLTFNKEQLFTLSVLLDAAVKDSEIAVDIFKNDASEASPIIKEMASVINKGLGM